MKLHLGCGEKYLEGYTNIDFPSSEHTVQNTSVADEYADITKISYKENSIDEIRLHHVFEHFDRVTACTLLSNWQKWIKPLGILRIEVPDFNKMALQVLNPLSSNKLVNLSLRHIFGSQEAFWAVHYAGYSKKTLTELLNLYSFEVKGISRTTYKNLHNIDITAIKSNKILTERELEGITNNYLSSYLVDTSESELNMLNIWMEKYRENIKS